MAESYQFIDININKLEKFHLSKFTEDGLCKRYLIELNETNVEQLISSIKKRLKNDS